MKQQEHYVKPIIYSVFLLYSLQGLILTSTSGNEGLSGKIEELKKSILL